METLTDIKNIDGLGSKVFLTLVSNDIIIIDDTNEECAMALRRNNV